MDKFQSASFFCAIIVCMKLTLDINNQTQTRLDTKLIRLVVLKTLKKSGMEFLSNKKISISLALVSLKEIKKLNRIYRRKNQPTDILSFAEYPSAGRLKKEKKGAIFLGELVICPDDIKKYAKSEKLDYKKELTETVSHGVLHLLGFRHGKKMFLIQDQVAKIFN